MTHLFTNKLRDQWGVNEGNALYPKEVAECMLRMVEEQTLRGGSVVHVDKSFGMRNVPGPQIEHPSLAQSEEERLRRIYEPFREILASDIANRGC